MSYDSTVIEDILTDCDIVKHAADMPFLKVLKLITYGNHRSSRYRNNFPFLLRLTRCVLKKLDKRQCSKFSALINLQQVEYFMAKIIPDEPLQAVLRDLGVKSVIGLYDSVVEISPNKVHVNNALITFLALGQRMILKDLRQGMGRGDSYKDPTILELTTRSGTFIDIDPVDLLCAHCQKIDSYRNMSERKRIRDAENSASAKRQAIDPNVRIFTEVHNLWLGAIDKYTLKWAESSAELSKDKSKLGGLRRAVLELAKKKLKGHVDVLPQISNIANEAMQDLDVGMSTDKIKDRLTQNLKNAIMTNIAADAFDDLNAFKSLKALVDEETTSESETCSGSEYSYSE
jgi:hypothetical protein